MSTRRDPLAPCRHCLKPRGLRVRRGLCWKCYEAPEVRRRYPQVVRMDSDRRPCGRPPVYRATHHLPRTAAYLDVLAERARHRRGLFHPLDRELRRIAWGERAGLATKNAGGRDAEGSGHELLVTSHDDDSSRFYNPAAKRTPREPRELHYFG